MMSGLRSAMRILCVVAIGGMGVGAVGGCRSAPPPVPKQSQALVKRVQMHMGTLVTLTAVAPTDEAAQRAVAEGFRYVRYLEGLWSTWIPTSELSQINAMAGKGSVAVSESTATLIAASLEAARLTEGGFNIAMGPVVEAWGISKEPRVPSRSALEALRPLLDLSAVTLERAPARIGVTKPGMRLDIGGIGKGYAADLTAQVMRAQGATAGVVALAGDIVTFGTLPDNKRFPVGIQHPRHPGEVLATIELQDEAISTAGDYERAFEQDGHWYHHILDPRTLEPARLCQSVTIVAKDGLWADGLDTGIFVMGPERGMVLIEALPDVEGVIVDAEGRVLISSGLRERVKVTAGVETAPLAPATR
ncbi:MAG: FAD:protein FMN transferase [Nitrospiraceae bacterium]